MSTTGKRREVVVRAERGTKWWALVCDEAHAVGQVRRLDQSDAEMREMIAEGLGISEDAFSIRLEVVLPEEYRQAATEAERLRAQAEQASAEAAALSRRAARLLAARHMTLRDIGTVMGISYQRAHQLVSQAWPELDLGEDRVVDRRH
ncbi:MAG: hypothetical protein LBI99_02355 [Propionibacteriaceae bacterium]|jgi:transcriptional regulator with XRE-family HTH domain|nr:hypothetical protein [Propionibacteriaceae bacterium]